MQDVASCELPDLDYNLTSSSMLDVTQDRSQHMINMAALPEPAGHVGDGLVRRLRAAYEAVMEDGAVDCREACHLICEDVVCRTLLSPVVETVKRAVEVADHDISSSCELGGVDVSTCSATPECNDGMVGYLKKIVTRSIDHKVGVLLRSRWTDLSNLQSKITDELKSADRADNGTDRFEVVSLWRSFLLLLMQFLQSLLMQAKAYRKSIHVLSQDIMSKNQVK